MSSQSVRAWKGALINLVFRMSQLPCLCNKFIFQGKKLPANISDDAEEGEVSDEDSADEIDDDCKLMNGDVSEAPI